ncbi:hypothetical protein [Ralstonia pseudosolanacearum]|uniref:hypothetical protein n=1 Tax=Ralstonia pseudosolanacearum TaxID=1310165 RepID=UPI003CF11FE5
MSDTLDSQTRQLAAMAYGEASLANNPDEIYAIASVLVRQRDARGYSDIGTFAASEPSFSFVVGDGNQRYSQLMAAKESNIEKNDGMRIAVEAAKNALSGGPDKSNGAYFWDGADIKSNYSHHFKVRQGIKFTSPTHNIYGIDESTKIVIKYKVVKIKVGKKTKTKKEEVSRYDHVYDSTSAYGGTIFWKFNPDFLTQSGNKEYK